MEGANNTLKLMNQFTRKQKIVDISIAGKELTYFYCCVVLGFSKGSDEIVLMASYQRLFGLYVYRSQNCSWQTYSKTRHPWKVVDFVVVI
jgi:hypothetical protein